MIAASWIALPEGLLSALYDRRPNFVNDRFSIAAHVKPPGYIVSSFNVPESYG
jgi:hypothetical protein